MKVSLFYSSKILSSWNWLGYDVRWRFSLFFSLWVTRCLIYRMMSVSAWALPPVSRHTSAYAWVFWISSGLWICLFFSARILLKQYFHNIFTLFFSEYYGCSCLFALTHTIYRASQKDYWYSESPDLESQDFNLRIWGLFRGVFVHFYFNFYTFFKDYFPLLVITKCGLYSPCCTIHA